MNAQTPIRLCYLIMTIIVVFQYLSYSDDEIDESNLPQFDYQKYEYVLDQTTQELLDVIYNLRETPNEKRDKRHTYEYHYYQLVRANLRLNMILDEMEEIIENDIENPFAYYIRRSQRSDNYEEKMEYVEKSIEYAEKEKDISGLIFSRNEKASLLVTAGHTTKALELYVSNVKSGISDYEPFREMIIGNAVENKPPYRKPVSVEQALHINNNGYLQPYACFLKSGYYKSEPAFWGDFQRVFEEKGPELEKKYFKSFQKAIESTKTEAFYNMPEWLSSHDYGKLRDRLPAIHDYPLNNDFKEKLKEEWIYLEQ